MFSNCKMRNVPISSDPFRSAMILALTKILDPLIDLMLDTGVTVHDLNRIARERTVQRAHARVSKENGRASNSRVAIVTGLPRSEVSRLLMTRRESTSSHVGQHPARKVLTAWHDDPAFLDENGNPAVLPIFGARRSFQRLVARHSGGIPVRAMLDQLSQVDSIDLLPDQHVKAKSRVPIRLGFSSTAVALIGDRTRDLLDTLLENLRTSTPLFEGTAVFSGIDAESVPKLRAKIAEQGAFLIESVRENLRQSRNRTRYLKSKHGAPPCRVGITAYYFQTNNAGEHLDLQAPSARAGRKNLRRKTPRARRGKR